MICLHCECEEFALKKGYEIEQEIKGETLKVIGEVFLCKECGNAALSDEQAFAIRLLTADEYRKKHRLMTSLEVRACREELQLNQHDFATLMGVGEASVKRWESGHIQDFNSDYVMRCRYFEELASRELRKWFDYQPERMVASIDAFEFHYAAKQETHGCTVSQAPSYRPLFEQDPVCILSASNEELALAA